MSNGKKLVPRLFRVIRYKDDKKISGVGKVIDGVVFADGKVVIQWQNDTSSISIFRNLEDFQNTHVKPIFNENEFLWYEGFEPKSEVEEALNQVIEFVAVYSTGKISDKTKGDIIAKAIAIREGQAKQMRGGYNQSSINNLIRNQKPPQRPTQSKEERI